MYLNHYKHKIICSLGAESNLTMSVLTREAILQSIRDAKVCIDPFVESQIGPASIDLHLGFEFRVFRKVRRTIQVCEETQLSEITDKIVLEASDSLLLMPGETCLGITIEHIVLPTDICGWLEGRSRFARLGLVVHSTAGFIQPGVSNRQVLEITNNGTFPLDIVPGVALCQLILQKCIGHATYQGRYQDQQSP